MKGLLIILSLLAPSFFGEEGSDNAEEKKFSSQDEGCFSVMETVMNKYDERYNTATSYMMEFRSWNEMNGESGRKVTSSVHKYKDKFLIENMLMKVMKDKGSMVMVNKTQRIVAIREATDQKNEEKKGILPFSSRLDTLLAHTASYDCKTNGEFMLRFSPKWQKELGIDRLSIEYDPSDHTIKRSKGIKATSSGETASVMEFLEYEGTKKAPFQGRAIDQVLNRNGELKRKWNEKGFEMRDLREKAPN